MAAIELKTIDATAVNVKTDNGAIILDHVDGHDYRKNR